MFKKDNTANMYIQAKDHASKALSRAGKSVDSFGKIARRVAAATAVYFGARAIKSAITDWTEAAAIQEESNYKLAQALANVGQYTKANYNDMRAYASSLQSVTRVGDESSQALMATALNMGLTADQAKEAVKGAIGLSAAFDGMSEDTALRGITNAMNGTYTTLQRYIPELRTARTEAEKQAAVQAAMARGFNMAQIAAKSGRGPMIQMKNTIGDIKEVIGEAFLPSIKESADKIKTWAQNNQIRIGNFAKKFVAGIGLVKDVLTSFINFFRSDWQEGFAVGLNTAGQLLTGFGQTAKIIIRQVLADIAIEISKMLMQTYETGGDMTKRLVAPLMSGLAEYGYANSRSWNYVSKDVTDTIGNTFAKIKTIAPDSLNQSWTNDWEKFQTRLKEINSPDEAIPEVVGGQSPTLSQAGQKLMLSQQGSKSTGQNITRESRFLGQTYTKKDETASNTKKLVELTKKLIEQAKQPSQQPTTQYFKLAEIK